MKMAASRDSGAAIVDLDDWRTRQRLHTDFRPTNQLNEPLRRLQALRRALDAWNTAEGRYPMPQPADFGLDMRNLRPTRVYWGDPA